MRIGFTGTQVGMSGAQKDALWILIEEQQPTEFHHGDCIGADDQADEIARQLGVRLFIHPPDIPSKRAYCSARRDKDHLDKNFTPYPYLIRNKNIVASVDLLVAAPRTMEEELRSGTWATVRYARARGIPIRMLER